MSLIKDTLFKSYLKSQNDADIVEDENGFILYRIVGEECYISEIYVDDKTKGTGKCKELINILSDIARFEKCTYLSGKIHLVHARANHTLAVALHLGFKVVNADQNTIVITKELGGN